MKKLFTKKSSMLIPMLAALHAPAGVVAAENDAKSALLASASKYLSFDGNFGEALIGDAQIAFDAERNSQVLVLGGNGYIALSNDVSRSFTLSAWINTNKESSKRYSHGDAIIWSDIGGPGDDFVLSTLGSSISFLEGQKRNRDLHTTASQVVTDGSWHHIAVSRQAGSGTSLYIDGVKVKQGAARSNTLNQNQSILIGANTLDNRNFNGKIDDVAFYKQALSDEQIFALAGKGEVAPTISVTAPANQTSKLDSQVNLAIKASSTGNITLQYSATNLPDGLQINNQTGQISGTVNRPGNFVSSVTVSDGMDLSKTLSFSWSVIEPTELAPTHYLPLDSDASDSQGQNDGVVTNVRFVDDPERGPVAAFNGNSHIRIDNTTGESFTLSTWIKTSANTLPGNTRYGHGNAIFWSDVGGRANDMIVSMLDDKLSFKEGYRNGRLDAQTDLTDNQWHHIAITRESGKQATLYIDGKAEASRSTGNGVLTGNPDIFLGANILDRRNYEGLMDDVRIYDSAISAVDVAALAGDKKAPAIVLTTPRDQQNTVNERVQLNVSARSNSGSGLSFTAQGLPSGLMLDPSTGLIDGELLATGNFNVVITVTDNDGESRTARFNWQVSEVVEEGQYQQVDFFNGRNFDGFGIAIQNEGRNAHLKDDIWKVENGVLVAKGTAGSRPQSGLHSHKSYSEYELTFSYSYDNTTRSGNSGVWIHGGQNVKATDDAFPKSIEVQLRYEPHGEKFEGDLLLKGVNTYPVPPHSATWDQRNPIGRIPRRQDPMIRKWNDVKIVTESTSDQGNTISVWINDKFVNKSINTTSGSGRITFQAEGSDIRFRNIVLKEKK